MLYFLIGFAVGSLVTALVFSFMLRWFGDDLHDTFTDD